MTDFQMDIYWLVVNCILFLGYFSALGAFLAFELWGELGSYNSNDRKRAARITLSMIFGVPLVAFLWPLAFPAAIIGAIVWLIKEAIQ